MRRLELWGGVECSVVRIGDEWRDQVRETGHHDRDDDMALVHALGIRTLRYPVLWERCTEGQPGACGWAWHDRKITQMQQLGINPIAGLLHHGAGPGETSLLDPHFPAGLAAHAGRVADRYPHIEWWTPVNEPLTTARFSCLYAYWHPHLSDDGAFLRALVNQCYAALLSMRAIRARTPHARFVHTEDAGHTFSTRPLQDQAAHENSRRWLSLDLLCGHVDHRHPWRGRLEAAGVQADVLDELANGEARPDVIGVNHYVTSERYLDHRQHLYPPHLRGSRGYADTEAARVFLPQDAATGWAARLRDVWSRYGLPIAITEAHLSCNDAADQVRWLTQAWNAAQDLRLEGVDIRAVTAWALFGMVDWDSMLKQRRNRYDAGVFDVRHGTPQRSALTDAVSSLAHHGTLPHSHAARPGWWERDDRVHQAMRRA